MRKLQRLTLRMVPRMSRPSTKERARGITMESTISSPLIMTITQLEILQNNLHKSREGTHGILNDPDMKRYAILMLQEQYWSTYTKSSPIHHAWTLIEPAIPNDNTQPRSVIYVNNSLITASQITPLTLPFNDVTAIRLTTASANMKPHLIINVYNPCDKSIIAELHKYLQENINIYDYGIIIIGGDFNTHHPIWNPQGYLRHDEDADVLVEMMAEMELTLRYVAPQVQLAILDNARARFIPFFAAYWMWCLKDSL